MKQSTVSVDITWPLTHLPIETGAGKCYTNVEMPSTVIVVSNKLSFASNPGIPCLLPASMKLWQINLLTDKYDKAPDSSQFLTMGRKRNCLLYEWGKTGFGKEIIFRHTYVDKDIQNRKTV